VLRRLLPTLLLSLLFTAPAQAVLIDSGDGTGNTTAPADDPGFDHLGTKGGTSVIYVGYGWVLSAAHVGLGTVVLGGVSYPALSGSRIVLIHSGTTPADLELFRIDPAPSLPPLPIRASVPAVDDTVTMIGNGRDRGDALYVFSPPSLDDGYYWQASRATRWGTNVVDSIEPDLDTGSWVTDSFTTDFSRSGTVDECQGANGDSGGAVFIKNAGTWELAGVMHSIGVFPEQVDDLEYTALYGNLTYAADLSQYRTQILDIVTPDCGNGYLTIDEECDDGNTDPGDCCSPSCEYESAATECRASAGTCDIAETCTGASADCPADAYQPSSTECRASAGICDAPDYCDGASAPCSADAKLTTECRPSAHACDAPELCNGVSDDCGLDRASNGLQCPDGDLCNGNEVCVGFTCTAAPPLVCNDDDICTTNSCDALQGCVFDPAPRGDRPASCDRPDLPSASPAGRLLLTLLLVGAGATFLARSRRFAT